MVDSKFCKVGDFREIYYKYSPKDFYKLLDFIYQREAIEEVVRLDNPEPGKKNGNK